MQIEWFIYHKNTVFGPFSTDDVNTHVDSGRFDGECFIWWKGEKDWIPVSQWQQSLPAIIKKLESHYNVEWKIRTPELTTDLMSFELCIEFLKKVELKNGIYICKSGSNNWENIYSNSIFMNALEMTRRKFPRVPVVATAKISKSDTKFSYLVKVNMIGEGGIGVTGLSKNFPIQGKIEIKLEGPNFPTPLFAEGKVVYHSKDGLTGIEFDAVTAEVRASIIDYVNQFQGNKATLAKKAG